MTEPDQPDQCIEVSSTTCFTPAPSLQQRPSFDCEYNTFQTDGSTILDDEDASCEDTQKFAMGLLAVLVGSILIALVIMWFIM